MSDNPYAPPEAGLELPQPARTARAPTGTDINIGEAINFVLRDPQWWSRCLLAGVISLIPILGWIATLGWSRRAFHAVREGRADGVPDVDLSTDLGEGWPVFLSILLTVLGIYAAVFTVMGLFGAVLALLSVLLGGVVDQQELAGLFLGLMLIPIQIAYFAMVFGLYVLMIEIWRRAFHGEIGMLYSPRASLRAYRQTPMLAVMAIIGIFVVKLLGGLGIMLFCIGWLITYPMGMMMSAHIIAQWDAVVERHRVPALPDPDPFATE